MVDKSALKMRRSFSITYLIAIFAVIVKTSQIFIFFNKKTGLIQKTLMSNILNIIFWMLVFLIVMIYIKLSLIVTPFTAKFKLGTPKIVGYVLFITSLLFFIQGIMDFIRHLLDFKTNLGNKQYIDLNGIAKLMAIIPKLFPLLTDILCVLSAISFCIIAMEHIKDIAKKNSMLSLIPVVWSCFLIFNTLMSISTVVSMQGNVSKVIMAILTVLFLQITATWACGYEHKKKTLFSVFIRISYSIITFITIVPFAFAHMIGIKDSINTVPYLCYIGLILYGFIVLIQFLEGSIQAMRNARKARMINTLQE